MNTQTITLSKIEYQQLKQIKKRYELAKNFFKLEILQKPAIKDSKKIINEFRETGLYNEKFLKSMEKGLKESSYFSKTK